MVGTPASRLAATIAQEPSSARGVGFAGRLQDAARMADSLLCVGLDPELARLPLHLRGLSTGDAILRFNAAIIGATVDLACAYKPNLGFYVAHGLDGLAALAATRRLIPPHIPVILDAKVHDIGHTAAAYARGYFDEWDFQAVTAGPYLGEDSLAPFLSYPDRGVFVLCKTSNPGGGDFQDLSVVADGGGEEPLYLRLAARVNDWATTYPASVGLVVGATYPAQLAAIRARCPTLPILLPGVGAQAGDLAAAVRAGVDAEGGNLLVSASRSIIFADDGPDFADAARAAALRLRDEVNAVRRPAAPDASSGS